MQVRCLQSVFCSGVDHIIVGRIVERGTKTRESVAERDRKKLDLAVLQIAEICLMAFGISHISQVACAANGTTVKKASFSVTTREPSPRS
jgi:hypothetical protein